MALADTPAGMCKYSNIFGVPGQGSHALRIGGLAAVDLLATAGAAFLLARYGLGRRGLLAFVVVFVILIALGIAAHEAFCVDTRLNATIFGRKWPRPTPAAVPNTK